MDEIKRISYNNKLFDYYEQFLTVKQKAYFIMYFQKDYSLKEIADYYNISRNAVYDLINITIKKLTDFETKLKLYEKAKLRQEYYLKYLETEDKKWLEKLMEIDDNYGI